MTTATNNPVDKLKEFFKTMTEEELKRVKRMIEEEIYDRSKNAR